MLIDIVTGVLASIIFLFISWIFKKLIIPTYKNAIYKGIKLNGRWDVYYNQSNDPSGVITFEQSGINIIGSSTLQKNRSGQIIDREYIYTGKILRNSIIFTFDDIKNPLTNGGTMVLDFSDTDSKIIKGKAVYYKPELHCIDTTDVTLKYKL